MSAPQMDETLIARSTEETVPGSVDFGRSPSIRSRSGRWSSALFIIGVEVMERFAYFGIASNLITYLTEVLGQSTATAAQNVNAWAGVASMMPLLGAFIADSYLGRYRTVIISSCLYILGLGLLTLSAVLTSRSKCSGANKFQSCSTSPLDPALFFFSLYLVALASGGHKPCVEAFGADQFDEHDPVEMRAKSSFFNWWYFGLCAGTSVTLVVVVYIQDNLNWSLGFGIPCAAMVVALVIFLLGTKRYRYSVRTSEKNPFFRIGNVFVAAVKNRKREAPTILPDEYAGSVSVASYKQFKFLNRALVMPDDAKESWTVCSAVEVEEAKSIIRLIPIWVTSLAFPIVYVQASTFFTKQGATMDRTLWKGFEIPAASLQVFIALTIVIFIPIYDRVFIPIIRISTHRLAGITTLQRIGAGIVVSIICMITAASVEIKRQRTAGEYGLVDHPVQTIPLSVWWLIPQYVLIGLSEALAMVGLQEFFYDQVPSELRSVGLSLYLSVFGIGSISSSILISIIKGITGSHNWFNSNLNKAHLDYFYWLLAGICTLGLAAFLLSARSYIYKGRRT